jgi:hypothetical protein
LRLMCIAPNTFRGCGSWMRLFNGALTTCAPRAATILRRSPPDATMALRRLIISKIAFLKSLDWRGFGIEAAWRPSFGLDSMTAQSAGLSFTSERSSPSWTLKIPSRHYQGQKVHVIVVRRAGSAHSVPTFSSYVETHHPRRQKSFDFCY